MSILEAFIVASLTNDLGTFILVLALTVFVGAHIILTKETTNDY